MPRLPVSRSLAPWFCALALGLGACDGGPLSEPCDDADPTCGPSREVVAGVDLTALFMAPTSGEVGAALEAVAAEERARAVEAVATVDLGGRETVTVLRGGDASAAEARFVGAVRQPPRASGDVRRRPLLLVLWDGLDADLDEVVDALPVREAVRDAAVLVFAAPRGGSLRVAGETVASSADADLLSPTTARDALALLDYVRARASTFDADPARVGIVGYGTGGHTALAAGARTDLDRLLVSIAAPTSLFVSSVRDAARRSLRDEPVGAFPGLTDALDATAGQVRDGGLNVDAARTAMLVRSPAFLQLAPGATPGYLFAVHGRTDTDVPPDHGDALGDAARRPYGVYLSLPATNHRTVLQDAEVNGTTAVLLCEYLLAGDPACS